MRCGNKFGNERYPAKYEKPYLYDTSEWFKSSVECDDKIDRYQYIKDNRDAIIDYINNGAYGKIQELSYKESPICNFMNTHINMMADVPSLCPSDCSYFDDFNDCSSEEDLIKIDTPNIGKHYVPYNLKNNCNSVSTDEMYVKSSLSHYCEKNKDTELLKILILKSEGKQFCSTFSHLIISIASTNNVEVFETIVEYTDLNDEITSICSDIMQFSKDPLLLIKILYKYNYKINDEVIQIAFVQNSVTVIEFALNNGHNVQTPFDTVMRDEEKRLYRCSLEMLKLLLQYNINVNEHIPNIFFSSVMHKDMPCTQFLVESYPECDINYALTICCYNDEKDILVYLLKSGADIHKIEPNSILNTSMGMVKTLVENGHPLSENIFGMHLLKCFVYDADLENIHWLVGKGADPSKIIIFEANNITHYTNELKSSILCTHKWEQLKSPSEYIISSGKMDHIKYMEDNYPSVLQSELNRLFVIAAANGKQEIMTYLLYQGAKLDEKALISACHFGHLEIVELLLKYGLCFDNTQDNLFEVIIDGYSGENKSYKKLIEGDDIFRNDIFEYGNNHLEIMKLLIKHNYKPPNWEVLATLPKSLYDVELFSYFLTDDVDPNKKFMIPDRYSLYGKSIHQIEMNLLEMCILNGNLEIIELVLQKFPNQVITCKSVLNTLKLMSRPGWGLADQSGKHNIKNLLGKYGVSV
jgi:ankyrin repeat protein